MKEKIKRCGRCQLFFISATGREEEKGIGDGDKMLISFPSTEGVKSGGRTTFHLGSVNVTNSDFYFLSHRHVRVYQRCSSLRCPLGSHGHDVEGVNQFLRREYEDVKVESRVQQHTYS